MKKMVALPLSLFAISAISALTQAAPARAPAADVPEVCKVPDPTHIKTIISPAPPNWFFRAFADSDKLSFASSLGNNILDYSVDPPVLHHLPGQYDPVPIGETVMSVPERPMQTYSVADIMADAPVINSVGNELIGGVYQSIAQLPSVNGHEHYRAVTDADGASYIDMELTGTAAHPVVTPVGVVTKTCSNQNFTLPMLSKDGTEIAGMDGVSNTSKIWKINSDGTCTEELDLGIPTGKVDFSFDNKKLVFHVTASHLDAAEYPSNRSAADAIDVYTYDRASKKFSKISQDRDRSSYFPVWKRNGTIVYASVDSNNNAVFNVANPALAASAVSSDNLNCPTCGEGQNPALAIGQAWYDLCRSISHANNMASIVTALSLDADQCKTLVTNYWAQYQAAYGATLTKEVLLAACPTAHVTNATGTTIGTATNVQMHGQDIAMNSCAHCHAPGRPQIYSAAGHRKIGPWDFSNVGSIKSSDKLKMINYIQPDPNGTIMMPPATDTPLGHDSIPILADWLHANLHTAAGAHAVDPLGAVTPPAATTTSSGATTSAPLVPVVAPVAPPPPATTVPATNGSSGVPATTVPVVPATHNSFEE
jgi:hypothetical protein